MFRSITNRILWALFLAPSLLLTAAPGDAIHDAVSARPSSVTLSPSLRGDVNGDGVISSADALAILNHVVGRDLPSTFMPIPNGDTDCNGTVTSKDALIVLMHVVGEDVGDACVGSPIVTVSVTPATAQLRVGDTIRLRGAVVSEAGDTPADAPVSWRSVDSLIASVDSTGLVTARGLGQTRIIARSYGDTASAVISVPATTTTIVLGPELSPGTDAFLTTIYSLGDSIDFEPGAPVRIPSGSAPSPLSITNAAGEPLLGALAHRGGTTIVDAHTTALLLGRSMVAAALMLAERDTSGVAEHVAGHPSFNSLVQTIKGGAASGQGYLSSPDALALVGEITLDLINRLAPLEQIGPAESVYAIEPLNAFDLTVIPVSVGDTTGTNYVVINRGYIHFVTASFFVPSEADTVVVDVRAVPKRTYKLFSDLGNPTRTLLQGRNGKLYVRVGQNAASHQKNSIEFIEAFIVLSLKMMGIEVRNEVVNQIAASILMPSTLDELKAADPAQRAKLVTELFIQNAGYITQEIVKSAGGIGIFKAGLGWTFGWAIKLYKFMGDVVEVLNRSTTLVHYFKYANAGDQDAAVCQLLGAFVECPERIEVPAVLSLVPGAEQTINAIVFNEQNEEIDDPTLLWQSRDESVVEVNEDGAIRAVAIGHTHVTLTTAVDPEVHDSVRIEVVAAVGGGPRLAGAGYHACALTTAGQAFCWGSGFGTFEDPASVPTEVITTARFVSVAAARLGQSCGLTVTGVAYCWGNNTYGALGDGTTRSRGTPEPVAGNHSFAMLTAGTYVSCTLTADGQAYCWGANYSGSVGDGTTTMRLVPTPVNTPVRFRTLAAGPTHVCGLSTAGQAYCWGSNGDGRLGDGTTVESRSTPAPVASTLSFIALAAGDAHTCALTADLRAFCWGSNDSGQLGDGSLADRPVPVAVAGTQTFRVLSLGRAHSCGLTEQGQTFCWGWNGMGQIGDGTKNDRSLPVPVATTLNFSEIAGGVYHTCGRAIDKQIYCWGSNNDGQLGDGTTSERLTPHPVATTAFQ